MASKETPGRASKHEVDIAVLLTNVNAIKESVGKIEMQLATFDRDYIKRTEFDSFKADVAKQNESALKSFADHASRLTTNEIGVVTLKTQIRMWAILGGVVLAIVQSVATAIIIRLIN